MRTCIWIAIFGLMVWCHHIATAQVVFNEIGSTGQIELFNTGTETVDMSGWWIYNTPVSQRLSDLPTLCGSLILDPEEIVVVNAPTFYARTSGELALFSTNSFGNDDALIDYVIWGSRAGNTSESIAVGANQWVDGDRAPGFSITQSLQFDRLGNSADNWTAGEPSICDPVNPCLSVEASIQYSDGTESKFICSGNGVPDPLDITVDGGSGDTMFWVVTDTEGTILGLPAGLPIDLEGAPGGTCLIYHVWAADDIETVEIGLSIDDIRGCHAVSNSLSVNRDGVDGGKLETNDGLDRISICIGEGRVDSVDAVLTGAVGDTSVWIVTDSSGQILGFPGPPPYNLEGSGDPVWFIYVLSYNGSVVGLRTAQPIDSIRGSCMDLSNPITVFRNRGTAISNGGEIVTSDGVTELTICSGDGLSDAFDVVLTGSVGANQEWVITDTAGTIVGLPPAPPFDLEGVPEGTCLVWHIAYGDGLDGLDLGGNIFMLTGGCSDLSNAITVHRIGTVAAELSFANGSTSVAICAGDNVGDPLDVVVSGGSGRDTTWLFTDADSLVIGVPIAPPFDLDRAGPGTCLIWHISHEGELRVIPNGTHVSEIEGCLGISNAISVNRDGVNGGSLLTSDSTTSATICAGDGNPDPLTLLLSDVSGSAGFWLITDTSGTILAQPPGPTFDLEDAGPGVCQIWHVRFEGDIFGNDIGNALTDLTGCLDLSNPVNVVRDTSAATCETTSFSTDQLSSTVQIYPNPFSIDLNIEKSGVGDQTYMLYDILGRLRWEGHLGQGVGRIHVDLSTLENGSYILHVREGNQVDSRFLLKQ